MADRIVSAKSAPEITGGQGTANPPLKPENSEFNPKFSICRELHLLRFEIGFLDSATLSATLSRTAVQGNPVISLF